MKKRIILIIISSFMFVGVVSAASLWGTYKGNQIIKLTVDGLPVKTTDVPAISYQGRTMVPIYLLQEAGINYTWDQNNQTVNINKPTTEASSFNPVMRTKEIMALGGGGVTLSNVAGQMTAMVYFPSVNGLAGDWKNIAQIFNKLIDFNAVYMYIGYTVGQQDNVIEIKTSDYVGFLNGLITDDQLKNLWITSGPLFSGNQSGTITPTSSITVETSTINSQIDGDFDGFDSKKIFKLLNGQIWQQTSFDYKYSYKYSPKVTIYKDGSYYYLIVDGEDKKVRVERIK
jgi:hypothetical protein